MPAEGESFDTRIGRKRLEDTGFVFVAAAGIPDGSGKVQFAQMRETLQFAELDGAHDARREIDGLDMDVARRDLGNIRKGLFRAFQENGTLPAEDPFSEFALIGALRGGCESEDKE